MLMRTKHRHNRFAQLDLFQAQPARPRWRTLPPEVKQQVLPLLAQLLREYHFEHRTSESGKGVSDE